MNGNAMKVEDFGEKYSPCESDGSEEATEQIRIAEELLKGEERSN